MGAIAIAPDRQALERLCRYVTRPPIALERLAERDDGCVEYAFRKPWRDGTRAVVLTAEDRECQKFCVTCVSPAHVQPGV